MVITKIYKDWYIINGCSIKNLTQILDKSKINVFRLPLSR